MTSSSIPPNLRDATSSAKLCYLVLDRADDPLSLRDLHTRARMPKSTAHRAVNDLIDAGVANEVHCPNDPHCIYFSLA